jgi:HAD superfamily hydrolase (TIGR01549 family)
MAKFKAVFFDLDGTLWDKMACADYAMGFVMPDILSYLPASDQSEVLLELNGILLDSVVKSGITQWRQSPRSDQFQKLLEDCGVHKDGLARELSKKYERVFRFNMQKFLRRDAIRVLQELRRRKLTVGVITNGTPAAQRHVVDGLDIGQYLDHVLIGEVEGFDKPDLRLFQRALALVACRPDEMLYVGDSLITDVLGASRAGIPVAWLKTREQTPKDGLPAPDFTIERLSEVLWIVDERTAGG